MTTLERAARALADVIAPIVKRSHGNYAGLTQEDMFDGARAVIKAIREPSKAMEKAGMDAAGGDSAVLAGYEAMIDALLEEADAKA